MVIIIPILRIAAQLLTAILLLCSQSLKGETANLSQAKQPQSFVKHIRLRQNACGDVRYVGDALGRYRRNHCRLESLDSTVWIYPTQPVCQLPAAWQSPGGGNLGGAAAEGAGMIYVAMFDEIDEGTAIFKCAHTVPVAEGSRFVPLDAEIRSDHYLWLTGKAGELLKQRKTLPVSKPDQHTR